MDNLEELKFIEDRLKTQIRLGFGDEVKKALEEAGLTREFCLNKINELLPLVSPHQRHNMQQYLRSLQPDGKKDKSGLVYIIKCLDKYKIGKTNGYKGLVERFKDFKTGNPFPIEIYKIKYVDNAYIEEFSFHQTFKNKRISGEWFNLEEEDLNNLEGFIDFNNEETRPPR